MFNARSSFIFAPAPLLIHAQTDDIAAYTDAFPFVSAGAEQNCFTTLEPNRTPSSQSQILIIQTNDRSLFNIRLHSLKILMNPEMISDCAAAVNETFIHCIITNGCSFV